MSNKKEKNISNEILALKQVRKENRETEIKNFGHTLCYIKVFKNKKKYTRKNKYKTNFF